MMAPAVRTLTVEYDSNTSQLQPGTNIYPVNVQQICYVNVSVTCIQSMSYVYSPAAFKFTSLPSVYVWPHLPHGLLATSGTTNPCTLHCSHCQLLGSYMTAIMT